MIREQFKNPFAENALNMFENTKQKFSIGVIPDCCFPKLNRRKIYIFNKHALFCMDLLKLPFWLLNRVVSA